MFESHVRTIRAASLVPSSADDPSIADLRQRAERSWLSPALSSDFDRYRTGLAAFHEHTRWRHRPAAWANAYQIAANVINNSADHDPDWTRETLASLEPLLDQILASIEVVRANLDEIRDGAAGHLSSQKLCDTYLDLFEGVFPRIARTLIALRDTRSPKRNTAAKLEPNTARELFEKLVSGQKLQGVLVPFDPHYRNKIAHRSTTIDSTGTIIMPARDDAVRYLSWGHLNEIANDAITVIDAFLAAFELSPHRPPIEFPQASVLAAELIGFSCVPLEQHLEEWEAQTPGIVCFHLRGPRCDEVILLRTLAVAFRAIQPAPDAIFIRFFNRAGTFCGSWNIMPDVLGAVDTPIESLKRAISESKCIQLRLERPYKKI